MAENEPVKEKIVYVERKRRGCMLPLLIILGLALVGGGIYAVTNPTKSGIGGGTSVKVGEALSVGSWKVTVEKSATVSEIDWSGVGNMEVAKGQFLKVYLTAENVTDKTDSPKSFDYKVRDDKGAQYSTCSELGCFGAPGQEKLSNLNSDIPPRTSSKILVLFDVAKDAKGFTLEIEGKGKVTLDR